LGQIVVDPMCLNAGATGDGGIDNHMMFLVFRIAGKVSSKI
jgi:hypothetical protein